MNPVRLQTKVLSARLYPASKFCEEFYFRLKHTNNPIRFLRQSIRKFLYNLCKKINTKILLIISLIIISLFSIFWVNAIQAPVKADQKFVLACAIALKNNDYHFFEEGQYLFMHPLQLGIVYFLRILIILILFYYLRGIDIFI